MNILGKTLIPVFLAAGMLASCNSFRSTPTTSQADMMKTAISTVIPAFAELTETQRAIPAENPIPEGTVLAGHLLSSELALMHLFAVTGSHVIQVFGDTIRSAKTKASQKNGLHNGPAPVWCHCLAEAIEDAGG